MSVQMEQSQPFTVPRGGSGTVGIGFDLGSYLWKRCTMLFFAYSPIISSPIANLELPWKKQTICYIEETQVQ